jgi:hypothetical protein
MAGVTIALTDQLNKLIGEVPDALPTAVRPLTASQRDRFVLAWATAPEHQQSRPADQWIIPEAEQAVFETFRQAMA